MTEHFKMQKYPRTPHLEGSCLQPGDEDLNRIPFGEIAGRPLVVEEKCDGANSAVSFGAEGELLLQSRGHYLTGGYRERHYQLMKNWAAAHRGELYALLGKRYIMYGEWLYAKHTVFYDRLPHYFLEFDILDRETGLFLDTPSRRRILAGSSVVSVPVLGEGVFRRREELLELLGPSRYVSGEQRACLAETAEKLGLDPGRILGETDLSGRMEGLYIKEEADGRVARRMKYVRAAFLQCVDFSETHWIDRPIVPNRLSVPLASLFEAPAGGEAGV